MYEGRHRAVLAEGAVSSAAEWPAAWPVGGAGRPVLQGVGSDSGRVA